MAAGNGFSDSGQVMLDRHDLKMDRAVILTVRHYKKVGYYSIQKSFI